MIRFYDNVFASAFWFYGKFYDFSRSVFRALLIVVLHSIGLFFLVLSLLKKFLRLNIDYLNQYSALLAILLFIFVIWYFIKYYSKHRVQVIMEKFEAINEKGKKLWAIITIMTLVIEYILIALLLRK
jgi:Ca2+/H+ antiporter